MSKDMMFDLEQPSEVFNFVESIKLLPFDSAIPRDAIAVQARRVTYMIAYMFLRAQPDILSELCAIESVDLASLDVKLRPGFTPAAALMQVQIAQEKMAPLVALRAGIQVMHMMEGRDSNLLVNPVPL